jgi:hypothetical protein
MDKIDAGSVPHLEDIAVDTDGETLSFRQRARRGI